MESFVTMNDVCLKLGICRDSCLRWIREEGLPAYKVGRLWRFKMSEVEAWFLERR